MLELIIVAMLSLAIGAAIAVFAMAKYLPKYLAKISADQLSQLASRVAEEKAR